MRNAPQRSINAMLVVGAALAVGSLLWMGDPPPGAPGPIGAAVAASPVGAADTDTSVPSAATVRFPESPEVDATPTF